MRFVSPDVEPLASEHARRLVTRYTSAVSAALLLALLLTAPDAGPGRDGGVAPLIPRAVLFGSPAMANPQLSPDGARLGTLEPDAKGVMQLWVRTTGLSDAQQVTNEPTRGLKTWRWTEDSSSLLYLQDSDGDERFHVFALELETKSVRDLTPWPGAKSEVLETSPKHPDHLLVTTNRRDPKVFDVVRSTGGPVR